MIPSRPKIMSRHGDDPGVRGATRRARQMGQAERKFGAQGVLLLLLLLGAGMSDAAAFSDGGGGEPGGCCAVPPELRDRARVLEASFARADRDDLARQSWAGELCRVHPCGEEIAEERARELLRDFFARAQRAEDLARTDWAQAIAWISAGIAGLSALISLFAVWQTHRSRRVG